MNYKRKLFGFLFLLGFVFQIVSVSLGSSVFAQTTQQYTPEQIGKAWQAGIGLGNCAESDGFNPTRSSKDLTDGEWFFEGINRGSRKNVGLLTEPDNGQIGCDSGGDIKLLVDAIGADPREFLRQTGIYELNGATYERKINGVDAQNKIKEWVERKFNFRYSNGLGGATQYALFYAAFDKDCQQGNDPNGTEVKRVNAQGEITSTKFIVDPNKNGVKVGYSLGGNRNQEFTCREIISKINQFSGEYSNRIKALNQAGVDTSGSNSDISADNNPSCETTGSPISWIMCPIINGLAESADFMFNNLIRPLLVARDIGYSDSSSGIFRVWSAFRSIANILLILILIVVVFGQAIGGGAIDSYTAKKVLPRIFAVGILINISIYLVVLSLDFANIIGAGINSLIYAGFQGAGEFKLEIGAGAGAAGTLGIGAVGAVGAVFAVGAGGVLPAVLSALPFIALFVILPAVLIAIAIFVTLVIRQGIIILLVITAPIALAAYVLPNTEKFFKQWWSLLFKTLMVYPIVMIIFAIADVMAVVVSGTLPLALDWLGDLIAVALLVIPLLLIPFAFKLAGGAIGSLYGTLSGFGKQGTELIKGDARNQNSLRNRSKRQMGETMTRGQSSLVQGEGGRTYRNKRRALVGRVADMFGDVDSRLSGYNLEAAKRREEQSQSGDDALIYAGAGWTETDSNGKKWFYDSKGRSISEQAYRKGKSRYGQGQHNIGQALAYTLSKAQSDEDLGNFRKAFTNAAVDQNWDQSEAMGVWAAATYPNKGTFASEWYSTPSVVKPGVTTMPDPKDRTGTKTIDVGGGATTGVRFNDVADSPDSYKKMVNDLHKNRQSFELGKVRDVDWRAMADHQSQVEAKIASGTATQQDIDNYAMTSEVVDSMVSRGLVTQNPDGEISVAGASAASQGAIPSIRFNSKYGVTNKQDASGNISANERVVYDKASYEAAKSLHGGAAFDHYGVANTYRVADANVTGDADRTVIPRVV